MIKHDDVSPDPDIELTFGALAELNESCMNCGVSQTWPSLIGAKSYKVERGYGKNPAESEGSPLKLFWHMNL